jgi:hypothetical protein
MSTSVLILVHFILFRFILFHIFFLAFGFNHCKSEEKEEKKMKQNVMEWLKSRTQAKSLLLFVGQIYLKEIIAIIHIYIVNMPTDIFTVIAIFIIAAVVFIQK